MVSKRFKACRGTDLAIRTHFAPCKGLIARAGVHLGAADPPRGPLGGLTGPLCQRRALRGACAGLAAGAHVASPALRGLRGRARAALPRLWAGDVLQRLPRELQDVPRARHHTRARRSETSTGYVIAGNHNISSHIRIYSFFIYVTTICIGYIISEIFALIALSLTACTTFSVVPSPHKVHAVGWSSGPVYMFADIQP